MDILKSPLGIEIEEITAEPNKVSFYYRAEVHANGFDFPSMKLVSMDTSQDFVKNFADESTVKLIYGAGTYAYRIYPYLDNLEITIYREPIGEVGDASAPGETVASQRFRATLLNPTAPAVNANGMNQPSEEALDLTNVLELTFQLQDKAIEQLRLRAMGSIIRKSSVEDIIRFVLTNESKDVDVDSTEIPLGVEMVPALNKKKYEQIPIPQGTRSVDVPQFLQDRYGVYPTGFSYYLFQKTWYVFPPFDNSRFDQSQKTATVIRIPENRMPGVERTFRKDGNHLILMVTGAAQLDNDSEKRILNQGNGVRFADANSMMDGFVDVKDNVALASRGKSNNEFVTLQRPTGLNNVQSSPRRITANQMVEYSELAQRDGVLINMSWDNSDPFAMFPGMQIKLLYLDDEEVKELYGTLVFAHHYTKLQGIGITGSRHFTTTNLTIFAKRKLDDS